MRKSKRKNLNPSLARKNRRKLVIRKKIIGDTNCPRICITKTNKHIVAQVIDDSVGKTLCVVQTFGEDAIAGARKNIAGAKLVGAQLGAKLNSLGVKTVVFDRNGCRYTGIIATVADSVRACGIQG